MCLITKRRLIFFSVIEINIKLFVTLSVFIIEVARGQKA